jgi:hypothetical protein
VAPVGQSIDNLLGRFKILRLFQLDLAEDQLHFATILDLPSRRISNRCCKNVIGLAVDQVGRVFDRERTLLNWTHCLYDIQRHGALILRGILYPRPINRRFVLLSPYFATTGFIR